MISFVKESLKTDYDVDKDLPEDLWNLLSNFVLFRKQIIENIHAISSMNNFIQNCFISWNGNIPTWSHLIRPTSRPSDYFLRRYLKSKRDWDNGVTFRPGSVSELFFFLRPQIVNSVVPKLCVDPRIRIGRLHATHWMSLL